MGIAPDEIFVMVFKRVMRDDLGKFSLDTQMLSVLAELDGKKTLAVITKKVGLNLGTMRKVISKLLHLRLIEPVKASVAMLDKAFFDSLNEQLSLAVGPIAEILIGDATTDLGLQLSHFPSHRAAELVDLLAGHIGREDRKISFKRNMVQLIRGQG